MNLPDWGVPALIDNFRKIVKLQQFVLRRRCRVHLVFLKPAVETLFSAQRSMRCCRPSGAGRIDQNQKDDGFSDAGGGHEAGGRSIMAGGNTPENRSFLETCSDRNAASPVPQAMSCGSRCASCLHNCIKTRLSCFGCAVCGFASVTNCVGGLPCGIISGSGQCHLC